MKHILHHDILRIRTSIFTSRDKNFPIIHLYTHIRTSILGNILSHIWKAIVWWKAKIVKHCDVFDDYVLLFHHGGEALVCDEQLLTIVDKIVTEDVADYLYLYHVKQGHVK